MDIKIISAVIGSFTAIVTFVLSQYLASRKEKSQSEFEKLDEIIEGLSQLDKELQVDFTSFLNIGHKNDLPPNTTFVMNRLEAIIKIYHPKLTKPIDEVIDKVRKYFSKKVQITNLNNRKEKPTKNEMEILAQELADYIEEALKEIKKFMNTLVEYGTKKMKNK